MSKFKIMVLAVVVGILAIGGWWRQRINRNKDKITPTRTRVQKVEDSSNQPKVGEIEKEIKEVEKRLKDLDFDNLELVVPKINLQW